MCNRLVLGLDRLQQLAQLLRTHWFDQVVVEVHVPRLEGMVAETGHADDRQADGCPCSRK